ncbi:MAG: succinate dehydrogenase assembly factor 2 [Maritimibacter sp.]|nr:succinate dehydrogenase assembly factor 2 [Maritimibacter sp.]
MSETPEHRLKRLSMRSHRRGTKEMDIILGRFADDRLDGLAAEVLDRYEALLEENDQDLYLWVTGQAAAPADYAGLVGEIAGHATARARD